MKASLFIHLYLPEKSLKRDLLHRQLPSNVYEIATA